ncbi:serine hydrolase [uncultured Aquimarina sp.]|uniref:serine hydrolase n=1 Tax=uncultured Aquimarina sp. TaxID=575652 RepID=UPI00261AE73B|nr:serine hydrolase [uncultured Aquimarina sp.]
MKNTMQFYKIQRIDNATKTNGILVKIIVNIFFTITAMMNMNAQLSSAQIDSIATKAFNSLNNTVGFAVGVVKDGKIVHMNGYGVQSIKTKEKVTAETPFGIASNSKAFTSAALALLVEQRKVKWEDKVIKHIPEFKMYNDYISNNFNVQDLLTHRSGLGLGAGDLMLFPAGSDFDINDVLNSFQYFKPVSPFRTKFDYDNLLYLVAGELIARVSGQSWESFISNEIIKPLEMKNTYASFFEAVKKASSASAHSFNGKSLSVIETPIPVEEKQKLNGAAGGIWASVSDMCKWMLLQLNEGKYGRSLDKKLFSEEQQKEMWRMHTPMNLQQDPRSPFKVNFSGYGLGWFVSDFNGHYKVEHSGLIAGMSSEVILFPKLELGIVVMNNSAGAEFLNGLVSYILLDEYLNLETGINWLEMAKGMQQQEQQMADVETEKVWAEVEANKGVKINKQNYIGIYEDNWFGKIEILEKNGELWFKSHKSPRLNGKMSFYKDHTFAIKWEYQDMKADAFAIFSFSGNNGKAMKIKMKGISRFIDFSFDFHDLNLKRITSHSNSHTTLN